MNGGKIQFHVAGDYWRMGEFVEIRMIEKMPDGSVMIPSAPVSMRRIDSSELGLRVQPLMEIGRDEAQVLTDALWDAGLRPTGGAGSVGQLGAVKVHLEDMRAIVADVLKVKLPGSSKSDVVP